MVAASATAVVIANGLGKAEYGAWSLAAGIAGLLVVASDLGMTSSTSRYVAQYRADGRLVAQVVLLRLAISVAVALVLAAIGVVGHWGIPGVIDGIDDRFVLLLPAASALLVAQSLISFQYGALPAMRRIRLLVGITVAQPLLELAGVVWMRAHGHGATGMLLASTAAAAVTALAGYVALARGRVVPPATGSDDGARGEHHVDVVTLRDVVHYGRQLFLVLLLLMVFGQVDQFVIWAFHGSSAVAAYALVLKLMALVTAPAVTITGIVAPRIAGARAAAAATYRSWLFSLTVLHMGMVLVLGVLAREVLVAINPVYGNASWLLVAMLPFMLMTAIAPLPTVTLNQVGLGRERLRIAAWALAVDLGLDLVLVPWLAAWGAVIATTIAFFLYIVMHHRMLVAELARTALGIAAPLRRALLAGACLSIDSALLALLVRRVLLDAGASAIVTVVGAGVIAGLFHLAGLLLLHRVVMTTERPITP